MMKKTLHKKGRFFIRKTVILGLLAWLFGFHANAQITYPENAVFNVLDYAPDGVTINDGVTDATPYIQAAFEDLDASDAAFGSTLAWSQALYFPAGTYSVNESVYIESYTTKGTGRAINLLGAGKGFTTIKLADNSPSFQDATNPIPVVSNAGNKSVEPGFTNIAFMNNIMDMTIDVGSGNPGAIGVRYIANNQGTMRNVDIIGDGSAYAGVDMERATIPGPALIKDVTVDGFQFGVRIAGPNYSMTMENIFLQNIAQVAFWNNGNVVTVRNLQTTNVGGASVANLHIDGMITLVESQLNGSGTNAIENDGYIFLRDITVNGYAASLRNHSDPVVTGPIVEFVHSGAITLWDGTSTSSLDLGPVPETPNAPLDPAENWVDVTDIQFSPDGQTPFVLGTPTVPEFENDIGPYIVNALAYMNQPGNEDKNTLYFPQGDYRIDLKNIVISGNVKRIIGNFAGIGTKRSIELDDIPLFRIEATNYPELYIERMNFIPMGASSVPTQWDRRKKMAIFSNSSPNDVVFRNILIGHGKAYENVGATGTLYIEDVAALSQHFYTRDDIENEVHPEAQPQFEFGNQTVWARQLDPEQRFVHVDTDGGQLWILGMKTEQTGPVIYARNNAKLELLGGFLLPSEPIADRSPAFIIENSDASIVAVEHVGFANFNREEGGYYKRVLSETRGNETKHIERGETPLRFESSGINNFILPLFVSDGGMAISCLPPAAPKAENITLASVDVSWAATGDGVYTVQYRKAGTEDAWIESTTSTNSTTIIGLDPHISYEVRIAASCGASTSFYSTPTEFETVDGENIVLNKAITADSEETSYPATNAVDGSIENASRFVSNVGGSEHWIEVDLGGLYDISSTALLLGFDGANAPENFVLQYWEDGAWVDITDTNVTGNPVTSTDFYFTFETATTSKVRLLTSSTVLNVRELMVFGKVFIPRMPYPDGTAHAIPGVIAIENFDTGGQGKAYYDSDETNNGGNVRPDEGVDIGRGDGGFVVGWTTAGEWMEYTINVAEAGNYDFNFRVASAASNPGPFHIEMNGVDVTGEIAVPNTGDWGVYESITVEEVSLNAGEQIMRVSLDGGNFGLGAITIIPSGIVQTPYPDGIAHAIPGLITPENFDEGGPFIAYRDIDATNNGGNVRPDEGVDIGRGDDGFVIGWTASGEWMEYTVNVATAGIYDFEIRVATAVGNAGPFHIEMDGTDVTGEIAVPNTGDWGTYESIYVRDVSLNAGEQVMRVSIDGGNFGLGSILATPSGALQTPYPNGTAHPIPGIIAPENFDEGGAFVAYRDADATNNGGQGRTDEGVDIGFGDGGFVIGWTNGGEWMEYTVNVAEEGNYNFEIRIATAINNAGPFHIEMDGTDVTGEIAVPNTGDWGVYETLILEDVFLNAGEQVMRVSLDGGNFGLGKIDIKSEATVIRENIALNKPVTAGELTSERPKEFAVDGDTNPDSRWMSEWAATLFRDFNIDLGGTFEVDGAQIFWGDNSASQDIRLAPTDFELQYWDASAETWTTIPETVVTGNGSTDIEWAVDFAPVTTSQIRLRAKAGEEAVFVRMREIMLFGTPIEKMPYPDGIAHVLPGIIAPENFDTGGQGVSYNDADATNNGGQVRPEEGVDITFGDNGFAIGWTSPGEWMEYTVNVVEAGQYSFEFRVATPLDNRGPFHIEMNGVDITGPVTVPNTGDWGVYESVILEGVSLEAGEQVMRVVLDGGGFGFGKITVEPFIPRMPYPDGTAHAIPGVINAAYFDIGGQDVSYNDREEESIGNPGFRTEEWVDIRAFDGGYGVFTKPGEWMEYTVNVEKSLSYAASFTYTSPFGTPTFYLEVDGQQVGGTVQLPQTGYIPQSIVLDGISLNAGEQVIRVVMVGGNFMLGDMAFTIEKQAYPDGIAHAIPGVINAAYFDFGGQGVSYNDREEESIGNPGFRMEEWVDIRDFDGGYGVFTKPGEWMEYTVNADRATYYAVSFTYTSPFGTPTFYLEVDGQQVGGTVQLPQTGYIPQSIVLDGISLNAGEQVIRVVMVGGNFMLGDMAFTIDQRAYPAGVAHAIPGIIAPENFDFGGQDIAYNDVDATNNGGQARTDEGVDITFGEDGFAIGWTSAGEWMEYTVNVAEAGEYLFEFRVATILDNTGPFHIEMNGVDVTGPVTVPNTGDWGTYESVFVKGVALEAGEQVMRVVLDGGGFGFGKITVEPYVVEKLKLTSMCSDNPYTERRWRVRNNNPFPVAYEWEVYGTSHNGTAIAAPGDSFFFTPNVGGANTTKIKWQNENDAWKETVKASGDAPCDPNYVVEKLKLTSFCSEDPSVERRWRVRNTNAFPVAYKWVVYGTNHTGTGVAEPGDSFFFTPAVGGANTTIVEWQNETGTWKKTTKASSGATCSSNSRVAASEFEVAQPEVLDWSLALYPNPAKEFVKLNIKVPMDTENGNIRIVDMTGRQVISFDQPWQKGNHEVQIPISQYKLSQGFYILQFNTGEQIINKKFLVE